MFQSSPLRPSPTCLQTLDFSSRYCSILAPSIAPLLLKWISMYFPKREELSLRIVLAFPKAKKKHKTPMAQNERILILTLIYDQTIFL